MKIIPALTPLETAKFWGYVTVKNGKRKCWIWNGKLTAFGYGRFGLNYKTMLAARVSYRLVHGAFDFSLCVLHHCDNPPCVNPNHLFLGTPDDNAKDRNRKNRQSKGQHHGDATRKRTPRGEKHYAAKLTENDVRYIRANYKFRVCTAKMLADKFGVSRPTVSDVINREKWTHVLL